MSSLQDNKLDKFVPYLFCPWTPLGGPPQTPVIGSRSPYDSPIYEEVLPMPFASAIRVDACSDHAVLFTGQNCVKL